jgi:hypothetical protein
MINAENILKILKSQVFMIPPVFSYRGCFLSFFVFASFLKTRIYFCGEPYGKTICKPQTVEQQNLFHAYLIQKRFNARDIAFSHNRFTLPC